MKITLVTSDFYLICSDSGIVFFFYIKTRIEPTRNVGLPADEIICVTIQESKSGIKIDT
jgi:hypothetical protein